MLADHALAVDDPEHPGTLRSLDPAHTILFEPLGPDRHPIMITASFFEP